jgi:hypothetical protein
MLLGMLDCGWFQPSQRDIENSTHIFTTDVLEGWSFGGGIGMDCKGRFPSADRSLQSYTNRSENTRTEDERSEVAESRVLSHSFGFSWRLQGKKKGKAIRVTGCGGP